MLKKGLVVGSGKQRLGGPVLKDGLARGCRRLAEVACELLETGGDQLFAQALALSATSDSTLSGDSTGSVLSLVAEFPGTQTLVVTGEHGTWPAVLDTGAPGAECFRELELAVPGDAEPDEALDETRAWRIGCP